MSLIDNTYFIDDIRLAIGEFSNLTAMITKYEKEFLQKLLGYELATLVLAYDSETSEQRIKDIVEGKEYTIDYNDRTQTVNWNGLKNTDLISPIAHYVYCMYITNEESINTPTGQIIPTNENAVRSNIFQKFINAYGVMKQLSGYYGQSELESSLYNFFLSEEENDTYPELIFTEFESVSKYLL